jgi:membrane fusion protein, multidrug efflux system
MKPIHIIILALVLASCSQNTEVTDSKPLPTVGVQTVESGLQQTIRLTGTVEPTLTANFSADTPSDVIQLPVRIGQTVQKGQLLMILGNDTLNTRLTNAHISLGTALESLNQTGKNNEQAIAAAELQRTIAENALQNLLQQQEAQKKQAQEQYNSTVLGTTLSVAAAEQQVINIAQTTQNTVNNALAAANSVIEYSESQNDLTSIKEIHVGVKDSNLRTQTENMFKELAFMNAIQKKSADDALKLAKYAETALTQLLSVLSNSVTSPDYSQVDLQTDIATISNRLSAVQNTTAQIQSAINGLNSAKQERNGNPQIEIQAKAQLDTVLTQLQSAESQARLTLKQAEQNVAIAKNQASTTQIGAKSTVQSIQNEIRNANTSLGELQITAPFDGTVQRIDVTPGETVNVGQSLITLEGDGGKKIVASITADERMYIDIGNILEINKNVRAEISGISPSADPITKKYTIESITTDPRLRIGEFVDIEIPLRIDSSVQEIFVPITAVHIEADETYVWLAKDTNDGTVAKKTPVILGDIIGEYITIESGLAPGDSLITDGNRSIKNDETLITVRNS